MVILLHVHLVNFGKPGSYAAEVRKELAKANLHAVEVSNDVDSDSMFKTIPLEKHAQE